jgi:hypothetical protein
LTNKGNMACSKFNQIDIYAEMVERRSLVRSAIHRVIHTFCG